MTPPTGVGSKGDEENTFAGTVAQQHPGGEPGKRKEVGTAASSRLHPPHVDENADDSPVQDSTGNPAEIPTLPANASGSDKVTTTDHDRGIDRASMYDKRTAEDKDQPPSGNAGK
jgi:hypothetical protein